MQTLSFRPPLPSFYFQENLGDFPRVGGGVDKSYTNDKLNCGEEQWTADSEHHWRLPAVMRGPGGRLSYPWLHPETSHRSVQQTQRCSVSPQESAGTLLGTRQMGPDLRELPVPTGERC